MRFVPMFMILSSAFALSCSSSDNSTPTDNRSPTWTNVYTTVVANRCAPCHTTSSGIGVAQGMLDMTSQTTAYQNLVNAPAAGLACTGQGVRVTPGDPDASVMYLKVSLDDPSPCGSKMPLNGPPLSQADADLIENWIKNGANDD
jgi:hypothetical protein